VIETRGEASELADVLVAAITGRGDDTDAAPGVER